MNDLISVIVPVYNASKTLLRCYNSLNNQTYHHLEIIFIDDGSTDDSLSICQEIMEKDKRVKVIEKTNAGVASARNMGIKESTGDYLIFVDSDDWIEENMCLLLLENAKKYGVDVVCCNYYINNDKMFDNSNNKQIIFNSTEDILLDYFECFRIKTCIWNKMYKKEIVCFFEENLVIAEDALFTCNVLVSCSSLLFIPIFLYHYNIEGDSLTRSMVNENKIISSFKAHVKQIEILKDHAFNHIIHFSVNSLFNSIWVLFKEDLNAFKNNSQIYKKIFIYINSNYKEYLNIKNKIKIYIVILFLSIKF